MSDFFESMDRTRFKHDILKKISSIPSNYVGSKRRLLSHIWDVVHDANIEFDSVFDAFSGSSMVSLLFKLMGKNVYSNDLLTSSSIIGVSLLENKNIPLTTIELDFLYNNIPQSYGTFVLDNYRDKFFTEKECIFLDRYKGNVKILFGDEFYCGNDIVQTEKTEKWRNITGKVTSDSKSDKYKGAFSLFAMENHIHQHCFLGGRYYSGQTVAKLDHRLKHEKSKGLEICDIPLSINRFENVLTDNCGCVFNADIVDVLKSNLVETDLLYLDPPYGGASSDYSYLYKFVEEYLYEDKLENLNHIQAGSKRFSKHKGYQDQFESLLSLCGKFPTWLISYNESSFADIDTIVSIIKNAGKRTVDVFSVPITYQYRKGKSIVDVDHESYKDSGHKYLQRGTEYLILAI